jgi:hypothetical protein
MTTLVRPDGSAIANKLKVPPAKTKGGVFVSDVSQERIAVATVCALVLKMGPLCYRDENKFPTGAWCKEGQWVIFEDTLDQDLEQILAK